MATVDVIKPDKDCNCVNVARERYKDMMIKNLIDLGMSGWMADFGEYVPLEARTHYPSKSWNIKDHGMVSLLRGYDLY